MSTASGASREFAHAIGVVGAASSFGAQMLLYLERERPDCWLVAIAERPLRWPVERISTYRLAQNRVGGILTMSDIPDFHAAESLGHVPGRARAHGRRHPGTCCNWKRSTP